MIIADSGFWFALYDPKDSFYKDAKSIMDKLETYSKKFLLPWPSLYETLNCSFTRFTNWKIDFKKNIQNKKFIPISEAKYLSTKNYLEILESIQKSPQKLSLTDFIINLMMDDKSLKINAIVTFNSKDFIKTAKKRNIQVIDRASTENS